MRPLGLLGATLSGAPPFAGLGTGRPSAGTYLRGDGVWSPLSVAPFANHQKFTSSGTFTVPAGVTMAAVMCIGGGGGNANFENSGGSGGNSSFGSLATAQGGSGSGGFDSGGTGGGSLDATATLGLGNQVSGLQIFTVGSYGLGAGPSSAGLGYGGRGAVTFALCPVATGQAITITVGAGGGPGPGGNASGQPGVVIVRY